MQEKDRLDSITRRITDAAIEVHRRSGPSLLESAYEACLARELRGSGFNVEVQKPPPVVDREGWLDGGHRRNKVVEHSVAVGIKTVEMRRQFTALRGLGICGSLGKGLAGVSTFRFGF
jgi:GxxExxY protein